MAISRHELVCALDTLLRPQDVQDYCPNGLQVEGADRIRKVITGVTASQALIDEAVRREADAILVHHGYFWKGEDPVITGMKGKRIRTLLANNINLIAYHLPVDIHASCGNNVQLGSLMGLSNLAPAKGVKPEGIIYTGECSEPVLASEFKARLENKLGRSVLHEGDAGDRLETFAWCTGGGQGYIEKAVAMGADAFITGEVSEQTIHVARELGIHFFAAGHHATERYGIKAVGEWLSSSFDITVDFIDIDNPA
ncbi:Nif3-like dinuclear metal center hexameric protein [Alteromonas sp. RKMC-009]|uniref:Nif3-like dinuclear metal center hexameric protein n=1 Tax=Alteromonas sp. RKMC-009 TaxID=2267264 RepID=UPI000E687807|nr:Nif3-like dinuclear metal center hexameric protein [Alteromonas sp. RKMC-009]AYA64411.1 Nif3-like dinuclear metal center hexameric protein [Alteromonas sp. RKMC-009]